MSNRSFLYGLVLVISSFAFFTHNVFADDNITEPVYGATGGYSSGAGGANDPLYNCTKPNIPGRRRPGSSTTCSMR